MTAGVPVLVTRQSGVAEVVESCAGAILVDPTLSSVLSGLDQAVQHPEMLTPLAERARAAAEREFSLEAHGSRLVAVYEQALARRRHAVLAPRPGAVR
jgi:glycosyltransferase involved in cell wall biosynthesis